MKRQYTKKQICEAIAYWKKQLKNGNYKKVNELNEASATTCRVEFENQPFMSGDEVWGYIYDSIDQLVDNINITGTDNSDATKVEYNGRAIDVSTPQKLKNFLRMVDGSFQVVDAKSNDTKNYLPIDVKITWDIDDVDDDHVIDCR